MFSLTQHYGSGLDTPYDPVYYEAFTTFIKAAQTMGNMVQLE